MRRLAGILAVAAMALGATTFGAQAAEVRACGSISQPYPGTKYADTPLSKITASGVTCSTARQVARGAHRKALRLAPPKSGVRQFQWNGWSVEGDVQGDVDRYVATKVSRIARIPQV